MKRCQRPEERPANDARAEGEVPERAEGKRSMGASGRELRGGLPGIQKEQRILVVCT
jgi:hypothetical protein